MTNREKARVLASEALNELTEQNLSIQAPIRKAIRVAALLNHPARRAWFQLQLIDLQQQNDDADAIKAMLEANFGDSKAAKDVFETVVKDYMATRRATVGGADKLFGGSVGQLEYVVTQYQEALRTVPGGVPKEIWAGYTERLGMLEVIKNRLQDYLISIESEEEPRTAGL